MATKYPLLLALALTGISNNSVLGGDFVGMVEVEVDQTIIDRIDPAVSDVVIHARVVTEAGVVVVAPFVLAHTAGSGLSRWHALVTVPAATGAGTYVLQAYLADDLPLPGKGGELDEDQVFPLSIPFRYLA